MTGTNKAKLVEQLRNPPHLTLLPIRARSVNISSSSEEQHTRSEAQLIITPEKGATPNPKTKVKSESHKDAHVKRSVFERQAHNLGLSTKPVYKTPQEDLSMKTSRLESVESAEPSKNTIVDLTSDSEEDDDDIYFIPNRASSASKPFNLTQPDHMANDAPSTSIQGSTNISGQESSSLFALLAPTTPTTPTAPRQDQMFQDDEAFARALQEEFSSQLPFQGQVVQVFGQPAAAAEINTPKVPSDPLVDCMQTLDAMFPGICLDFVAELFNTVSQSIEQLIDHILSKCPYPRTKDKQAALKRKREMDPDEEAAREYSAPDRVIPVEVGGIRPYIRTILGSEFPNVPMGFIDSTLSGCSYRLFSAHQKLFDAVRTNTKAKPTFKRIIRPRKIDSNFTETSVVATLAQPTSDVQKIEVLKELQLARKMRRRDEARYAAEREAELQEEENFRQAEADGLMGECGCCYGDYPLNRMVHCNGDNPHSFCRDCARRNAETEVGKSKYQLNCMSVEACKGGFSLEQRLQFLDENTRIALDRNEQEAALRLAGIENLESCPFCPFAMEYPPIENDREFRCQAPDCENVSCRLCREESHIPKTCEENMKDKGLSIRRQLEEAMSAALIRKCNKCGTPFVKEEGCNKMTCTRNGCHNMQCYICSKSCDYSHFNDPLRGGRVGNCPLFDSVEARHESEVSKAEQETLQKIMTEHPEYTEKDLKIKMSEDVKKDDERRKNQPSGIYQMHHLGIGRGHILGPLPGDGLQGWVRPMAADRVIPACGDFYFDPANIILNRFLVDRRDFQRVPVAVEPPEIPPHQASPRLRAQEPAEGDIVIVQNEENNGDNLGLRRRFGRFKERVKRGVAAVFPGLSRKRE